MSIPAMFASIALGISSAFGGPFHDAEVTDQADATTDVGGSIVDPGSAVTRSCSAQVDACTEAMRAAEGYADKDVRIIILAATLEGPLGTDATIEMLEGGTVGSFSIQSVDSDTMLAYHECRARPL